VDGAWLSLKFLDLALLKGDNRIDLDGVLSDFENGPKRTVFLLPQIRVMIVSGERGPVLVLMKPRIYRGFSIFCSNHDSLIYFFPPNPPGCRKSRSLQFDRDDRCWGEDAFRGRGDCATLASSKAADRSVRATYPWTVPTNPAEESDDHI
jgi:hypothetical protein